MTMPSPEPSPHVLTERSASFNRAEFNKVMRTRINSTDSVEGVESIENLTAIKSSVRHIRHSSLDSAHPSALHPISLNAKFDNLLLPLWPSKLSVKASVDLADKEGGHFLDSDNHKVHDTERGGETQEELVLDPDEALFQDAQEESVSTSMSTESKSPREELDFILWGNAAFCLSEAKGLTPGNKALGLPRRPERTFGGSIKNQKRISNGKDHPHLLSRDESPHFVSSDRGFPPLSGVGCDQNHVAPTITAAGSRSGTMNEAPIAGNEESLKCDSSVGSTISSIQAQNWAESSVQKSLMSSEAQSCCLDFDAQDTETSAASDSKISDYKVQDIECSNKEVSKEANDEEEAEICSQQATQIGGFASSQAGREAHEDLLVVASEEVKIRAELELEIERDLEEEIKTKIYLLSRRLEQLHVLKATRHPRQDQHQTEMEVGSSTMPSIEKDVANVVAKGMREAQVPKSPSSKSPKSRTAFEQSRSGSQAERASVRGISSTSSKKQLSNVEIDEPNKNPFASLRKFIMPTHAKENSLQPPLSDSGLRNVKILKNSIEGLASATKPKIQGESMTGSKQDYQSWTVNTNAKKFDWIRTLRSDVPCTPRLSSMRANGEEASPFLHPKEPLDGNVARALFTDEGSAVLPKKTPSRCGRKEGLMTPVVAGSLKRSSFSSSKLHGDPVASTPRIRNASLGPVPMSSDNDIKSASAKKVASQKLPIGTHAPSPLHKTPDLRQARISAPSIPRPPFSKHGKNEKPSSVDTPSSPTHSLKNAPLPSAEKAKRSVSAPPSVPVRGVSLKDSKATPMMKALPNNKQASSAPQGRGNRVGPSFKPGTSSSQASKGRTAVPSDNLGKRPSASYSKPTAASAAKGIWH